MIKQLSEIEFEKLIFENQLLIIKVCNIYCKSQADKDDLFQDITINLWRGLSSFKGESKISTWIYRVSLNTAISKYRKQKQNQINYSEKIPELSINPDLDADQSELIRLLYSGIEKLKPIEKAIVLLYLEEKSYDEISEIIGISVKNVSVRLVRLKRKLEHFIKPLINV